MLAVLGFTITGLLFILFSLTMPKHPKKKSAALLDDFKKAYLFLAVAFLGYGLASVDGSTSVLAVSMIIGNALLLIGTLHMLRILVSRNANKKLILYLAAATGIALVLARILFFYPEPYMQDEILVFNTQRFVSFMLSALFLLVWLPVNLRVARMLTLKNVAGMDKLITLVYTAATFSAVIFILAKKPVTLALSFTAVSAAFVLLIAYNIAIRKLQTGAKHG